MASPSNEDSSERHNLLDSVLGFNLVSIDTSEALRDSSDNESGDGRSPAARRVNAMGRSLQQNNNAKLRYPGSNDQYGVAVLQCTPRLFPLMTAIHGALVGHEYSNDLSRYIDALPKERQTVAVKEVEVSEAGLDLSFYTVLSHKEIEHQKAKIKQAKTELRKKAAELELREQTLDALREEAIQQIALHSTQDFKTPEEALSDVYTTHLEPVLRQQDSPAAGFQLILEHVLRPFHEMAQQLEAEHAVAQHPDGGEAPEEPAPTPTDDPTHQQTKEARPNTPPERDIPV